MSFITRIALVMAAAMLLGCGPGGTPVPENTIPTTELIKNDLKSIATTNQLGSEMVTIDQNIEKLAETDPEKAAELRKDYEKLQQSSGSPAGQAKKMMEKL